MITMGDWEIIHKFSRDKAVKVEIGTANGLTSILISKGGGKTYTIDIRKDLALKRYLERYGIEAISGDSVESAELFEDDSIDFLFIDGSHGYDDVKRDYAAWFPKVKRDCPILMHDVDRVHGGVFAFYQNEIEKEKKENRIKELWQKSDYDTNTKVFVKI